MPQPLLNYKADEPFLVSEKKSIGAMAKDTRVTFDHEPTVPPPKSSGKSRRATERQISYEDAENCVNEMSESFPALSNRAHRLMRQVSGSFNSKTIKVCLILSIILNLLLGIPFGVFLGMWLTQKNDLPSVFHSSSSSSSLSSSSNAAHLSSSSSSSLSSSSSSSSKTFGNNIVESCFLCSSIGAGSPNIKFRSRNNICCTDDKMLDLDGFGYFFLSEEYITRKLKEVINDCRGNGNQGSSSAALDAASADRLVPSSAAHMYLDLDQTKSNSLSSSKSKQTSSLAWKTTDQYHLSFVRSGLHYENGQITILKAGTYHVYSHMTLNRRATGKSSGKPDNRMVVHSIMKRYKKTYPPMPDESLLIAQITVNEGEIKTSSLEGSFEFQEGDRISVYVSYPSLLMETPTANVFGLFRL